HHRAVLQHPRRVAVLDAFLLRLFHDLAVDKSIDSTATIFRHDTEQDNAKLVDRLLLRHQVRDGSWQIHRALRDRLTGKEGLIDIRHAERKSDRLRMSVLTRSFGEENE